MTTLRGAGVGRGAVVGPVARAHPAPTVDASAPAEEDRAAATASVVAAFASVADTLEARAERSSGTVANVLTATAAMARDTELTDQVAVRIDAGQSAPFAVDRAVAEFVDLFTQAGGYLAERVTDLLSVRDRVLALLTGQPEPGVPALTEPAVVVADDLSPADTAALELDKVLAIVIERGGPTGHTAIIAGQLGIPCVVRVVGASTLTDGTVVAVDAAAGTIVVDPDDDVRARVEVRRRGLATLAETTDAGSTSDGHGVALLANIGTAEDAERLTGAAVEGVGLFRTEVLYLGRTTAPTEDEQAEQYARALTGLEGRKVVIRTLDAGADKPLAFVTRDGEENPALGVRGFRLVRADEGLLRTQLRAIARAAEATGGEPWVMAPMVATVEEAAQFAALARDAGVRTVGVMVEVPSAALRAADLLAEVDFISIGTNDLAQYTMATDRLLGELVDLLDPWQPAVLDLVATAAAAGTAAGKPVGVCGESAADPLMALVLTGMGVTSLSMSPAAVPGVRFALSRHSLDACRGLAKVARAARTAADARAACLAEVDAEVREILAL
ncbi:phosphoenolpyruvate--protein phosphotransferase [Cellulomonas cellasea]|uniref:Phosphoenolpyruvate-protein phosphotransferase n=2 Tax=Cellulomonas cellasea TaxID=43670 RepID=A0A0A0B917_9CELL|nr:phosphoenolpyruvate--protein phosphotransferase [Cellulomonas cellasea]KGM02294.1 phosphoenolpyruvate-protein phosphotransferase [Cellulomonas cellasea DSM 20118]GEA88194.1 phosphoenolpyruvate-protein phosphotransferase [Cellulomonas cellasea]